jgi:hypothetical protein
MHHGQKLHLSPGSAMLREGLIFRICKPIARDLFRWKAKYNHSPLTRGTFQGYGLIVISNELTAIFFSILGKSPSRKFYNHPHW